MKIADPSDANRGQYSIFIGYYAITPWSNMYIPSDDSVAANCSSANLSADSVPFVDLERIDRICEDMTMEEVVSILQMAGRDIGFGTIIHEYRTQAGTVKIVYYIDSNGVYRVFGISEGDNEQ